MSQVTESGGMLLRPLLTSPFVMECDLDGAAGRRIYDRVRKYYESGEFIRCRLVNIEVIPDGDGKMLLHAELSPDWFEPPA